MLALSVFEDKDSFSVNLARPDLPKRKSNAKVLEGRIVKHLLINLPQSLSFCLQHKYSAI